MAKLSDDGCREWYVSLSILNNIVDLHQTVTIVRPSKTFNKSIKSTLMNCNEFFFLLYVYLFFCSFWWLNMIVIYETKKVMLLGPVHRKPEKSENAALYLWLGLSSTLISQENGAFRQKSMIRHHGNQAISIRLPEFLSNAYTAKRRVIVMLRFRISPARVVLKRS